MFRRHIDYLAHLNKQHDGLLRSYGCPYIKTSENLSRATLDIVYEIYRALLIGAIDKAEVLDKLIVAKHEK